MNYLAHAYLSFGIPEITVGNLISDFVKGKKKLDYQEGIRKGIVLHRAIDTFTDSHAVTRRAKSFFREGYGLYSGPLTDIIYDHFLANDPLVFPPDQPAVPGSADVAGPGDAEAGEAGLTASFLRLQDFAQQTYEQVGAWQWVFPERFARMFPYMRSQNWLYHYRFREGIFNSFTGLSRRALYMGDPEPACRLFETHYAELEACYRDFFPAVKDFAFQTLKEIE